MEDPPQVKLPLLRGTAEGADCETCPHSHDGAPNRPVFSEHPVKPLWAMIGDLPSFSELRFNRPLCGPSGVEADKILAKIGRPRDEIFVGTAALCAAPPGSTEASRDQAASACRGRLQRELAKFPGIPVLTLGAVAARAVIPKAALDAIDPPDVPESKQKRQKKRQGAESDAQKKREKKLAKLELKIFKELLDYHKRGIIDEIRQRFKKKPTHAQIEERLELEKARQGIEIKAKAEALVQLDQLVIEKAKKPKKKKPIKISDIVSTCFDVDIDGSGSRPIIPAIHPASLLRGGGRSIAGSHTPDLAFINLTYDFGKVDALGRGKDVRLKLNVEIEGQDSEKATWLFVGAIQRGFDEGEIALDLETYVDDPLRHHALMAYVARIRAIGLATKRKSISVLWDLIQPWGMSYFQALLASSHVKIVTQNGIYDRTVLRANGFEIHGDNYQDTLYAHHSAFPGCAHNLQQITAQFFGVAPWKSEFRNSEEDTGKLLEYNAKDTGATLAIRPAIEIVVKKNANERTYAIDLKMAEIASRMHIAGMPVSREVNSELLTTFSKNVAEGRQHVEAVANDPKLREGIWHHLALEQAKIQRKGDDSDFETRYNSRRGGIAEDLSKGKWRWKVSSAKHVAALLQAIGVNLHQVTKSGSISTKKEVLEGLVNVPIVRDLLLFRENDKLLSTFIWQIFDRTVDGQIVQHGYADANDRVHPIWNVHKISGRWASYEPVVSNVPKAKYEKIEGGKLKLVRPNLRRQVRVTRPGRKLVGFDFSQLEARNLALISGDEFLCKIFAEGRDIHTECARVIFKNFDQREEKERKQLRDLTKQIEYGTFYGGSPETCWKVLLKAGHNVKLVDVASSIATLMRQMTGIVRWQRQTVAKASLPPYTIRDFVLGRRRVFPMGQVDPNEALNFESQATAAAIMDSGMAAMDARIIDQGYKEVDCIVQVHDAAAYEVWEDDAEDVAQDIHECFSQQYERDGITIPYPVDVRIGDSWDQI